MIADSQLSLSTTPWSLFASMLVVVLTAAIGYFAWRQSGYATTRGLQELFRLLIVGLVALLLNQPEWIEQYQPDSKPTVVVLWDDSHSMQTQDAANGSMAQPVTRAKAIESLKLGSRWMGNSDQDREVVIQSIGASKTRKGLRDSGTDLSQPVLNAISDSGQLLAVVMVSDGDWNTGDPPADAASRLKLKRIPLHTVAVGSPARLPDVDLVSVESPTFAVAAKP